MVWGIGGKKKTAVVVKPKTDPSGYTEKQKKKLKKGGKALSPIERRRKAMDEIMGR